MGSEFREFGVLTDGVVDLVVEEREPSNPAKRYCPCYHFGILLHGKETKVGELRLRIGAIEEFPSLLTSGHLGYEVGEAHRGKGYATRASLLASRIARAHGFRYLVITCDPANVASRRTCERLGARLVGEFDVPPDHSMYEKGRRRVCRYQWELTDSPS